MFQVRSTQFRENMTWNSQTQGWIFQPKFFWEWFGWIWYFFPTTWATEGMRRLRPVQKYPIPTEITATHDWDVNHEGFEFCGFYTRAPGSDHGMMPKTYPIGPQLISGWFLSNVRRRSVLWISFLECCREIMASDATYHLREAYPPPKPILDITWGLALLRFDQ